MGRIRMLGLCLALFLTACGGQGTTPTPPSGMVIGTPVEPGAPIDETPVPAPTTGDAAAGSATAAAPAPTEGAPEPTATEAETSPTSEAEPTAAATATTEAAAEPTAPPVADLSALQLELEPYVSGFNDPLLVTHAGDGSGRLFVVERGGRILVIRDGEALPTPFLDITSIVGSGGQEQGLLGLAFHPDYANNGAFFVNYTNKAGHTMITRFRASDNPDVANPESAEVLLQVNQPAANHNGGMLTFGPDGHLYIGLGDGGAANDRFGNGQNPTALLGKMLRIAVGAEGPYTIPEDNPFVGDDPNGVADEIWAIGMRNPWRYTFDRETADFWVADVGQNTFEEINKVGPNQGGLNYGWPIMEGRHCFNSQNCNPEGLVMPVAEYRHDQGCSVTGGYVYRGPSYPQLQGVYLYGDFCSGRIWGLSAAEAGTAEPVQLTQFEIALSSFGEDESGDLYVTDLSGGGVYRLVAR